MKLVRTTEIQGSFQNLLKQAKTGDVIVLYEGKWDDWGSYPKGVVIRLGNKFLLIIYKEN